MAKDDAFASDRLQFRGIRAGDAADIVRWRSRPEVYRYFVHPHPVTLAEHADWFLGRYLADSTRFDFMVLLPDGTPIGTVGLSEIDGGSAEISYMIGEEDQRHKGYAREAIYALMVYGQLQGIHRFIAVVHPENTASIRAVEALGYVLEAPCGEAEGRDTGESCSETGAGTARGFQRWAWAL